MFSAEEDKKKEQYILQITMRNTFLNLFGMYIIDSRFVCLLLAAVYPFTCVTEQKTLLPFSINYCSTSQSFACSSVSNKWIFLPDTFIND